MSFRQDIHPPRVKTGMLIRKPVADVFEAFVDPAITSQFWFTKGSGRLELGNEVHWTWEMYGFSIPVTAKVLEPNRRIVIDWPGETASVEVEWSFTPVGDHTFVEITCTGFTGDLHAIVKHATDVTEGFALVLAGAKAWLEHGIRLNLVADRFPKGLNPS